MVEVESKSEVRVAGRRAEGVVMVCVDEMVAKPGEIGCAQI